MCSLFIAHNVIEITGMPSQENKNKNVSLYEKRSFRSIKLCQIEWHRIKKIGIVKTVS